MLEIATVVALRFAPLNLEEVVHFATGSVSTARTAALNPVASSEVPRRSD